MNNKYSDSEHTLEDLLKNENIRADRFGLAAISYIFKAFGDVIRSKEYWPWGSKVNFSWDNGKDSISGDNLQEALDISNWQSTGNLGDLTRAMLCIKEAQIRSKNEETQKIKTSNKNSIKDLQKRLARLGINSKTINRDINNVNNTSKNIKDQIDFIGK